MESQKYYDFNEKKGCYCVFFANRRGLSVEEITEIFQPFGHVANVTKAGDDFGYRFVSFFKEDEVLRCVEGMKSHPFIQLKVKDQTRKKPGIQNNQKNFNDGRQSSESRDNNRRSFEAPTAEKSAKGPEINSRISNSNDPAANLKINSAGDREKNYSQKVAPNMKDVGTQINKFPDTKATFEAAKPATPLRQPEVAAKTFMPDYAKTSHAESMKNSGKSFQASSDLGAVATQTLEPALPAVHLNAAVAEMPKLVVKSSALKTAGSNGGAKILGGAAEVEPQIVTAAEVVVANIHSDYGVHYILHLIQKHDPLCVSEMKIIPILGLRYCIVYLQSLHQAQAIEKEFDRFKLCEKELIVIRPQRLLAVIA